MKSLKEDTKLMLWHLPCWGRRRKEVDAKQRPSPVPWYPVREGDVVGTHSSGDQQTFFQFLVPGKDTAGLHPGPVCSTQPIKWNNYNFSKCPPARPCSAPSCQELGTSRAALVSGCLCVWDVTEKDINEEQKEDKQALPTWAQLHATKAAWNYISAMKNQSPDTNQTLESSTSMLCPAGWLVFSAWPSSCFWVWSPPNVQIQFFLYGKRGWLSGQTLQNTSSELQHLTYLFETQPKFLFS